MLLNGSSPPQIRAARVLLGWSRADLAHRAQVSIGAVARIESGAADTRLSTFEAVHQALVAVGIEFVATPDGGLGVVYHPSSSGGVE